MGSFKKIDVPPEETEELVIIALDDYKEGLDQSYVDPYGLDQLSTFFIALRPARS